MNILFWSTLCDKHISTNTGFSFLQFKHHMRFYGHQSTLPQKTVPFDASPFAYAYDQVGGGWSLDLRSMLVKGHQTIKKRSASNHVHGIGEVELVWGLLAIILY